MKYRRSCSVVGTLYEAAFSMRYIKLYEPEPFIGNLPVQFSYENETHPLRKHMLPGIGLRPISAQDGDFALCGERPKALPLETASPLEKGLDPKPFVIKTGRLCKLSCVSESPKTVSLTNSLAQCGAGNSGRGGQESFCPAFFKKRVI